MQQSIKKETKIVLSLAMTLFFIEQMLRQIIIEHFSKGLSDVIRIIVLVLFYTTYIVEKRPLKKDHILFLGTVTAFAVIMIIYPYIF